MASVQDRKAPSAGTKVTCSCPASHEAVLIDQVFPGQDAPVSRERAGYVASESLAAESYRADGEFATNRGAQPDKGSPQAAAESSNFITSPGTAAGGATHQAGSNSDTAPSYIANQYFSDPNGPHGKNLTGEGFDDARLKDGLKMALDSEPGSKNDPSRLAEAQFKQGDAAQPSVTGHRQGNLETTTAYETLSRETSS